MDNMRACVGNLCVTASILLVRVLQLAVLALRWVFRHLLLGPLQENLLGSAYRMDLTTRKLPTQRKQRL